MSKTAEFIDLAAQSLKDGTFAKLTLGHYTGAEDLKKITVKKIVVKRIEKLGFTYTHKTKDIAKNYDFNEGLGIIKKYLGADFHAANLFTTEFDLAFDKNKLRKSEPTVTEIPSTEHDRAKNRVVAKKPYLHDLGVTDASGNVLKSSQDKFRQIDKYVEILSGLVRDIPQDKIKNIVDMGSGKGYLTFALYDYLAAQGHNPTVTGVEYRTDMVDLCTKIAAKSGFDGLKFQQGTIENYDASNANILIALHACDTATDDALAKGIAANAELIVVAPCCHKQIRNEMEKANQGDLEFITRHGIFMERQAEMVTDGLRALILEYFGYSVKVFEFISGEHTAKNVMIVGTRNPKAKAKPPALLAKIADTKARFGITRHHLEKALNI